MTTETEVQVTSEEQPAPIETTLDTTIQTQPNSESSETVAQETSAEAEETVTKKDFNKAWYKRKEAERRADDLQRERDSLQAKLDAQAQPTSAGEEKLLTLEAFDYDEDALNEAKIDRAVDKRVAASEAKRKEDDTKRATTESTSSFIRKQAEYAAENEGYMERNQQAVDSGVQFTPAVQEVLLNSEAGPALHDHLLSNPAEIDKINSLPPLQAAAMAGRLEAQLTSQPTPEKKTTTAPSPIETLSPSGGGTGDPLDVNDPNISIEEMERRSIAKWNQEHGR